MAARPFIVRLSAMEVHCYDLDVDLDALVRDARRAVEGWDWNRGASDTRSRCPRPASFIPAGDTARRTTPASGSSQYAALHEVFEALECEKASFRLLRREPGSAYAWHTDRGKGSASCAFKSLSSRTRRVG
jgi:hypothetical protein